MKPRKQRKDAGKPRKPYGARPLSLKAKLLAMASGESLIFPDRNTSEERSGQTTHMEGSVRTHMHRDPVLAERVFTTERATVVTIHRDTFHALIVTRTK